MTVFGKVINNINVIIRRKGEGTVPPPPSPSVLLPFAGDIPNMNFHKIELICYKLHAHKVYIFAIYIYMITILVELKYSITINYETFLRLIIILYVFFVIYTVCLLRIGITCSFEHKSYSYIRSYIIMCCFPYQLISALRLAVISQLHAVSSCFQLYSTFLNNQPYCLS